MTEASRAPAYIAHIREHPEIVTADLRVLAGRIPPGARVLDIGAGPGGFVVEARLAGYDALALDIEISARAVWAASGTPGVLADAFRLPFRTARFDIVRIKEVIEHVDRPRALLEAASSVLAPGGLVIAHVPSPYSQFYPIANFWDDYTHVRPLTRRGLQRLFEDAGLCEIEIRGYVAGRNAAERAIGNVIGRIIPHTYRIVARKPLV
jgi:SAM-dependent methyltransferase